MDKVIKNNGKLKLIPKPELVNFDSSEISEGDVLVICAGFEDRALSVLEHSVSSGCLFSSVLMFEYLPYLQQNKSDSIVELCRKNGIDLVRVTYDRGNPAGISIPFIEFIKGIPGKIFIDISAMSRLLIVQLIVALGNLERSFHDVFILYTEALNYPPNKEDVEQVIEQSQEELTYRVMFISSGVFDITVVPELSSVASQGSPIHLVVFPSFNIDQLVALRGEAQPSQYTFIHGIPHLKKDSWRQDVIKRLNHTDQILRHFDVCASTLDYRETLDNLFDIYEKCATMERIIVAPTGSKMQTVAVGIFRTYMDDIQIVYPTPSTFAEPERYTSGIRSTYLLSLESFIISK